MIIFWLDQRPPFFIPDNKTFNDGSLKLSYVTWFYGLFDWHSVKIDRNFLNKGYKI